MYPEILTVLYLFISIYCISKYIYSKNLTVPHLFISVYRI